MGITYQRTIIGKERDLGFLYVPAIGREFMPELSGKIKVQLTGSAKVLNLSYNSDYNRVFGLTEWYKQNKVTVGTVLQIELTAKLMVVSIASKKEIQKIEKIEEEEHSHNLSGLSSAEKGNIGEDRVKELILLYGDGLLNVFKPVIDNRGIDLIVMKDGFFHPIYLQVKARFNVNKSEQLILTISGNTFSAHTAFYIVGISFNASTLELDDKILLVPSRDLEKLGIRLTYKNNIRVAVPYNNTTKSKWAKYFISKSELVDRLLTKFEAMSELVH